MFCLCVRYGLFCSDLMFLQATCKVLDEWVMEHGTIEERQPFLVAALCDAASKGQRDLVASLIQAKDMQDVDAASRTGETAFWWAARANHPGIMSVLHEAGAEIDKAPPSGWTPLMAAAYLLLPTNLPSPFKETKTQTRVYQDELRPAARMRVAN
jgi:hypothetical protein